LPFDYAIGNIIDQASNYVEKTIPGSNNIADFKDKDQNYLVFELY
jgi:tRNA A37 threonylcarbamoyltransferase TsaD